MFGWQCPGDSVAGGGRWQPAEAPPGAPLPPTQPILIGLAVQATSPPNWPANQRRQLRLRVEPTRLLIELARLLTEMTRLLTEMTRLLT